MLVNISFHSGKSMRANEREINSQAFILFFLVICNKTAINSLWLFIHMIIICFASRQSFGNGSSLNVFPTASPDLFFCGRGGRKPRQNNFFFQERKANKQNPWTMAGVPRQCHHLSCSGGTSSHLYHCSSKGDRQDFQSLLLLKNTTK